MKQREGKSVYIIFAFAFTRHSLYLVILPK
uniref:Uncharacterized protein n=1 Tax=Siphoviridae sp. ctREU2 TaxID=2826333 RepID=A0A8S5NJW4_9CAUD|nr:MAG TPA: hypothetical protein [Siphoviridae sp. ctREU2]